jgi:TRAP-type C4-dicarboxylate transport system permease small subunit
MGSIDKLCSAILRITLVLLVVIITYQVIMRYVFNSPPTWTEEISLILMIYLGLLGGAWGVKQDIHLSIKMFVSKLPAKPKDIVNLFSLILIFVFSLFIIKYGFELMQLTQFQTLPATKIKVCYTYLALPLTGVFFLTFSVERMVDAITQLFKKAEV